MKSTCYRSFVVRALRLSSWAGILSGLAAQQIPNRATTEAASESTDAVELSPFVVNTDRDVGYVASNSLAGSRMNQSLKDTAAAISVFTPDFLADIGAFDVTEALSYATNVELQLDDDRGFNPNGNETVGEYQGYRVRGLKASSARNYFVWNLPSDVYNLGRIEESRGPNAVLFGIASAGGLINASTKQARSDRRILSATVSAGSFGSWRTALDVNQPIIKGKAAVRLNLLKDDQNTFRHFAGEENLRAHFAASFAFSNRTRFRAETEFGRVVDNMPRSYNLIDEVSTWEAAGRPTFAVPVANVALGINRSATAVAQPRVTYIGNNDMTISMRGAMMTTAIRETNRSVITDPRFTDYSINVGGPAQDRYSDFNTVSAYLEHRFGRNTHLEIAYNRQKNDFISFDPRSNAVFGDPNQLLLDGSRNEFAQRLYLENGWFRRVNNSKADTWRATLSTEYDAKKWGNYRIAGFTEYEKSTVFTEADNETWIDPVTGIPPFHVDPENANNTVQRRVYVTEGDWASYIHSGPNRHDLLHNVYDPVTGRTLSSAWGIPRANAAIRESYLTQKAYMVAGQARYFGGRVIFAGGIRWDYYDEHNLGTKRDPVTKFWTLARNDAEASPLNPATRNETDARNITFGVVYHFTPNLSAFVNVADNISLPARGAEIFNAEGQPGAANVIPPPPPKGQGRDVGLAAELLEGRLNLRAAYYTTSGKDQSTSGPQIGAMNNRIVDALYDAGRISQTEHETRLYTATQGLFDHHSEGLELRATANMTRNWRFQASYALTKAVEENLYLEYKAWDAQNLQWLSTMNTAGIITENGNTIAQEIVQYQEAISSVTRTDGGTKLGNRPHKFNFFTRYNFPWERLKGAYVGGGYRYQSKNFAGLSVDDRKLYGSSFGYADAMAGYMVSGLGKGRKLSFQLNVANVFDKDDPLVTRYTELGGRMFILREVVQPPRTWRLTMNVEY